MSRPFTVKPTQTAVKAYYEALGKYADQGVDHEGAVRTAFQNLLDQTGRRFGWALIPELSTKTNGQSIRPDGTFRDEFHMKRGFWEAKDTHDDLEAEVQKKINRGYPLSNTIFEDTCTAYLYQNGRQAMKVDLRDRRQLCDLLNAFFARVEPAHETFGRAIDDFKERVPELARGLVHKIDEAHASNARFQAAFDRFFGVCQASLNPNLSRAAVDEMLVQHLLTERLIRTIFDNQDFTRRNVIAAEVENVVDALVSKSFDRHAFLRSLDVFYTAIEAAAATIEGFTEKQRFLNLVYERFFQGYSVKVADTHGIVYTPPEIVDFMCASVAEVLEAEFGKKLGDPGVHILDPCTGTGNFIVNLIGRIPKRHLPRMYREQLFANEVMLMPYYIAALNIEHAYYEATGEYEPFEGLCFVDSLDLAESEQRRFGFMTERNAERVERQKKAPITVIVGNPPYNANQINESDNNKNRRYPIVEARIRGTYARESKAGLKNKLYDPYVKFFRWARDRLEGRDGIVCLITNNNYFVDKYPFDGMRRQFRREFTRVYHLDLHGNARRDRRLSGTAHNVFGIPVGVGITIAVQRSSHRQHKVFSHRVPEEWQKDRKLSWCSERKDCSRVQWEEVEPDSEENWLKLSSSDDFATMTPIGTREVKTSNAPDGQALFKTYSVGVKTNRDEFVYAFARQPLLDRMKEFVEAYNEEVDRLKRASGPVDIDSFVRYERVKWDGTLKQQLQRYRYGAYDASHVRTSLYRPYTSRLLYFDPLFINRVYLQPRVFPAAGTERKNVVMCCTNHSQMRFSVLLARRIPNEAVGGRAGQTFPFYIYDEDGCNARENVTDWAMRRFRDHYGNRRITKWDIFYYVYGILHHPGYRERYAENLKRELPRIPLAPDFRAFSSAGKALAALHLDYEELEPYELEWVETPDVPLSYRVEKMRLSKDKRSLRVNDSLNLAGIPPEVFDYRLGNRSALDWVIDQYRVKTDKRSGITSDPNRPDDPQYIVRLVGQVVHVSLETVKIVAALPDDFGAPKS